MKLRVVYEGLFRQNQCHLRLTIGLFDRLRHESHGLIGLSIQETGPRPTQPQGRNLRHGAAHIHFQIRVHQQGQDV